MLELLVAPRGLITVLLFFSIPEEFQVAEFEPGILLFVIIVSSILMAVGLIKFGDNQTQKSENTACNQDNEVGFVVENTMGQSNGVDI
jgi:NhaP-type Na+/H+ or K+/H+ antiporter